MYSETMGMDEKRVDIDFEIGETVKVKEGPFANFMERLKKLIRIKRKLKFSSICSVEIHR